jgi:hypothetical protein
MNTENEQKLEDIKANLIMLSDLLTNQEAKVYIDNMLAAHFNILRGHRIK